MVNRRGKCCCRKGKYANIGVAFATVELDIADLASEVFVATWERAFRRAKTISDVRFQRPWDIRRFEYQHFYSAWMGVAFRLRACLAHSIGYVEAFKQPLDEEPIGSATYAQDEELFGFFVTGLSAVECFCYGLYALGALCTSTPPEYLIPSQAFPLLDPSHQEKLKQISMTTTLRAYERQYRGVGLTAFLRG